MRINIKIEIELNKYIISMLSQILPHTLCICIVPDRIASSTLLGNVLLVWCFYFEGILFLSGRRSTEYYIECEFESIINHPRYEHTQQGTTLLDAGVGVDLYEPELELLIQHEVEPKDLEVELTLIPVQLSSYGHHALLDLVLHFWYSLSAEVEGTLDQSSIITHNLYFRQLSRSSQESWFPLSKLPQFLLNFWIALLVR